MISDTTESKVKPFSAPRNEWWRAFGFCICCSLVGLKFYPALLPLLAFFLYEWRHDRYFFVVELIIVCTGSGFLKSDILPIKFGDIALLLSFVGIVIYRKNRMVRRVTFFMFLYFLAVFAIALTSTESISSQFPGMRYYFLIAGFYVLLLVFANRGFDFKRLMHVIVLFELMICGFYVFDTFIINGSVLLPGTDPWYGSSINRLIMQPFQFHDFLRHYPPGLYWMLLLIIPINYGLLKFRWYHWALLIGALISSRTNTLLFALLVCFVFFRPKKKQIVYAGIIGVVLIGGLYVMDKATGGNLRVVSTFEQFGSLEATTDVEDLADFGTGRMAQVYPKMELLYKLDRQWLGFGFLDRERTTNPIYQITNEMYSDISRSDEVATGVEVQEIQTILDIGYIGLIIQLIFYVGVYFMIRPLRYSNYYLCTLVGMEILGIGGFAGLNGMHSTLLILGLVLGAILLANKPKNKYDTEDNTLLLAK